MSNYPSLSRDPSYRPQNLNLMESAIDIDGAGLLSRSRTVERDITEDEEDWEKWHGMEAILPELKKAITKDPKTGKLNGWAALSVTRGPDDILEKLKGNLDITSIISGLLLTVSVPYLSEPPDSISSLDSNDWRKNGFVLCIVLSVICHLCSLFIASALVNSFNTAARNSDFFRLIIKAGMVPTMSYMTYCGGNTFLACAIALAMQTMYNTFWAVFFISMVFVFCIGTMFYLQYIFNREAHVVHGWAQGPRGEQYDLNVPLEILEHYAYLDKESRLNHAHTANSNNTPGNFKNPLISNKNNI